MLTSLEIQKAIAFSDNFDKITNKSSFSIGKAEFYFSKLSIILLTVTGYAILIFLIIDSSLKYSKNTINSNLNHWKMERIDIF
jgi:hypothetical protein